MALASQKLSICGIGLFCGHAKSFHGIIIIDASLKTSDVKTKSLSELIGAFKTTSSKLIHQAELKTFHWQKSFYDRIIRNEIELFKIRQYIQNNPLKWEIDKNNPSNIYM